MKQNLLETIVGLLVLVIAGIFIFFAYNNNGDSKNVNDGYTVKAVFQNAEGIMKGSDIMIAGIKIGKIHDLVLNQESYMAELELKINDDIKLPKDSLAAIVSSGIIGGKYINIVPGSEEEMLGNNEVIHNTQSSLNLEALIGKFLFSKQSDK